MTRREQLDAIFKNVDENERELVDRLIGEVAFLEDKMEELRALPFVAFHPTNPARQKTTAAAKLYKECSQSYMNAIRILAGVLRKVESTEEDALMRRLDEFI